jgi:capsular exopolysaccharide synthesis family protein
MNLHPDKEDWSDQGESSGWQRHWRIISGHKLWIALFCLIGGVAGFAVFVPKTPVYAAATTLELQPINQSFMNIGSIDPLAGSFSEAGLNAQTQIAIIRSSSVVGPALDRMERESSAVVAAPVDRFSRLRSRLGFVPKEPVQAFQDGLKMAGETLSVRVIPGTRIIEIRCESSVPEVAANFVNAVASEYMYQNLQYRSTNAQKTSQWLAGELEENKTRLEQAEAKLQEFSRKAGNLFVSEADTLSGTRLKQLQSDLAAAQTDRINKQTLYQASQTRPIESFPSEFSGHLAEEQSDLDKLKAELAQLSTTYTPSHYRVQRVQAQIAQLEEARDRERKNILTRIQSDYQQAENREKLLMNAYRAQAGAVSGEADKASEYGSLKREVEILRQSLNSLLQQSNQTAVASAVPVNSARVVDPAKPPSLPTGPGMPRHILTGFALGGLLGYASSLLRDGLKQKRQRERFGLPGSAARVLNVPELGIIPSLTMDSGRSIRALVKRTPAARLLENGNGNGNGKPPKRAELVTWTEKPSLFAESFRLTLASLTISGKAGGSPAIVVVASGGPAEGKTTVATNIAIARAETNRRVLLLETDLRKPRFADIFGLSNPKGWSDLIQEEGEFQPDRIEGLAQPTHIPGLFAMAGGTSAPELIHQVFNSPKVPLLLAALRRRFDMVIIDTPPLLQFSEARLIGRLADGVVLVLRSDHTNRTAALACRQRLWEDGIPILGTVLNDWNPHASQDQRYMGYYNAYTEYYSATPKR